MSGDKYTHQQQDHWLARKVRCQHRNKGTTYGNTEGVGRYQVAGGRNRNPKVARYLRQQSRDHELGGADAENREKERKQRHWHERDAPRAGFAAQNRPCPLLRCNRGRLAGCSSYAPRERGAQNRSPAGCPNVTNAEPHIQSRSDLAHQRHRRLAGLRRTPRISSSLSTNVLTFSQSVEAPLRYGEPRRLQTIPSRPNRSAALNSSRGVPPGCPSTGCGRRDGSAPQAAGGAPANGSSRQVVPVQVHQVERHEHQPVGLRPDHRLKGVEVGEAGSCG